MPVKTIRHVDGRTFKFGRKRSSGRVPHFKLKDYLVKEKLPAPPASVNYGPKASTVLSQMYDNDTLGDCVIAGIQHVQGVLTGNAGSPLLFTDAQTVAFYSAACGYTGDPSTDDGCDVLETLQYWEKYGNPSGSTHKCVGKLAVDPTDVNECKLALWLFENLIFGVELPDKWINPFPFKSGFTWGPSAGNPDPNNGHCFISFGYETNGNLDIATWGMTGYITPTAVAKYASASANGELYTVISQDQLNAASKIAPNGLNWSQLVADWNAMGGSVTPPPVNKTLSLVFLDQNGKPMSVTPDAPPTWTDKDGAVEGSSITVPVGEGTVSVTVKIGGKTYTAQVVV